MLRSITESRTAYRPLLLSQLKICYLLLLNILIYKQIPIIKDPIANKPPNIFPQSIGLLTAQETPRKITNAHTAVTMLYLISLGTLGLFIKSAKIHSIFFFPPRRFHFSLLCFFDIADTKCKLFHLKKVCLAFHFFSAILSQKLYIPSVITVNNIHFIQLPKSCMAFPSNTNLFPLITVCFVSQL